MAGRTGGQTLVKIKRYVYVISVPVVIWSTDTDFLNTSSNQKQCECDGSGVSLCVSLPIFGPCELSDTTKLSFMRQTQGVRKPSFNFAHTGSWRCPFTLLHFYSCTDLRRKFRSWSFPTHLCKPGVVDSICRPTGDMPTMLASPKLDVSFSSGLFIHYLYFI